MGTDKTTILTAVIFSPKHHYWLNVPGLVCVCVNGSPESFLYLPSPRTPSVTQKRESVGRWRGWWHQRENRKRQKCALCCPLLVHLSRICTVIIVIRTRNNNYYQAKGTTFPDAPPAHCPMHPPLHTHDVTSPSGNSSCWRSPHEFALLSVESFNILLEPEISIWWRNAVA